MVPDPKQALNHAPQLRVPHRLDHPLPNDRSVFLLLRQVGRSLG